MFALVLGKVRLQPLKGVEAGPDINPTLPVIASITPTQGGYPVQAEPGIVSVPEGVGVRPSKTEAGIISVPGVEDPVGVGHAKGQGRYPQKGRFSVACVDVLVSDTFC